MNKNNPTLIDLCWINPTRKKIHMKYRLTIIFLLSLLFASFSFNFLHYDALIRADFNNKFDNEYSSKIINSLHKRVIEIEQ